MNDTNVIQKARRRQHQHTLRAERQCGHVPGAVLVCASTSSSLFTSALTYAYSAMSTRNATNAAVPARKDARDANRRTVM